MNNAELIQYISEGAGITKKDAGQVLSVVVGAVSFALGKEGSVNITGLGAFRVYKVQARVRIHPSTGLTINVPASKKPNFKPCAALKNSLN